MSDEILDITVDSSELDFDGEKSDSEEEVFDHDLPECSLAVAGTSTESYSPASSETTDDELPKLRTRSTKRKYVESGSDFDDEQQDKSYVYTDSCDDSSDEEIIDAPVLEELESSVQEPQTVDIGGINSEDVTASHDDKSDSSEEDVNVEEIVVEFKKKIKKQGISQRQAAKMITKCSQSALSEAIGKAHRLKSSKHLTARGMDIYHLMKSWNLSREEQRKTLQENAQQRMMRKSTQKSASSSKKSGKSTRFSFVQLCVLVELFKKNSRPSAQRKQLISETLELEEHQVSTWFNNQRARNFSASKLVEKMKREGQQPVIPQSWDVLLNSESTQQN